MSTMTLEKLREYADAVSRCSSPENVSRFNQASGQWVYANIDAIDAHLRREVKVPDDWFFADGPEGYFYSPSAEDANNLISKTGFDRDDWTVTSLAATPIHLSATDGQGGETRS